MYTLSPENVNLGQVSKTKTLKEIHSFIHAGNAMHDGWMTH